MILAFVDPDGDPVAVESEAIVGISVYRENRSVTLVHTTATADRPFMVAAEFADVLHRWTEARGESLALRRAHPGVFPLVEHQYPGGAR